MGVSIPRRFVPDAISGRKEKRKDASNIVNMDVARPCGNARVDSA
jgi:hypothetical protein